MADLRMTKSRGYWFQRMVQITGGAPIKVPFFTLPGMPFLLRRIRVVQADVEYNAGTSFSYAIPRIKASLYIASGNVKVWPEAPVDALLSNLRQTAGGIQRIFQPQPADMQNYGVGWQGSAPGDNYPVNYKYAANAQILVELTGQAVVPALIGATGPNDTGIRPDYVEITLEGYNIDDGAAA